MWVFFSSYPHMYAQKWVLTAFLMLVFNFLIPYFASLSAFCERKGRGTKKKSPHLDTKVRGFFVMPPCQRRFCGGRTVGWGEGAVENLGSEEILFLSFSAFLHSIES